MGPSEHDEVLAYTSHLPTTAGCRFPGVGCSWSRWLPLAARAAYKDGCRVAAADAGLWTAIFRENRGPLLKALGTLQEQLDALKYALMTDDEEAIGRWWLHAKERRDQFDAQNLPPQLLSGSGPRS